MSSNICNSDITLILHTPGTINLSIISISPPSLPGDVVVTPGRGVDKVYGFVITKGVRTSLDDKVKKEEKWNMTLSADARGEGSIRKNSKTGERDDYEEEDAWVCGCTHPGPTCARFTLKSDPVASGEVFVGGRGLWGEGVGEGRIAVGNSEVLYVLEIGVEEEEDEGGREEVEEEDENYGKIANELLEGENNWKIEKRRGGKKYGGRKKKKRRKSQNLLPFRIKRPPSLGNTFVNLEPSIHTESFCGRCGGLVSSSLGGGVKVTSQSNISYEPLIRTVMGEFKYFLKLRLVDYAAVVCGSAKDGTVEVCVVIRLGEKEWDRTEEGMKRKVEEEEGRRTANLKGVVIRVEWRSAKFEVVRWFKPPPTRMKQRDCGVDENLRDLCRKFAKIVEKGTRKEGVVMGNEGVRGGRRGIKGNDAMPFAKIVF